jgi:hypothetical protein
MDQLITVEEVSEHLKNPPSLDPRPDFLKIRALQKHIIKALKKLLCPQSQMHGWTGLVMDPALYVLLEPTAFIVPVSPGDVPTYPGFASPSIIKNIDNLFERDRNYYLSFVNINRACFTMLDDSVNDRYKVSNTPNLTGWNSSMTIREIIVQLTTNYGVPDAMVMFNNDKLFRSPFPATEPPEMLFHRLEQCQEVQTIGQDPYTETHIINVAVRILMQSGMFQPKEFETWAAVPLKTYQALKTFIHGAYTRRLTAITLRNTAGQLGYVANQNLFNMLSDDNPDDGSTDDTATTITHTAAAVTTGVSSLGQTYAPTAAPTNIPSEVATAIQQLSANQTAIMQQMAAMTFASPPAQQTAFHVPPVPSINVPGAGYQQNRGGRRGGSRGGRGRGRNTRQRTPRGGQQVPGPPIPPMPGFPLFAAPIAPPGGFQMATTARRPEFSNTTKYFPNWNVCFSCGFDVEDWHTSATCPADWRKQHHQDGFTRANAQQYITAGYKPCQKGMHKNVLPTNT